MLYPTLGAALWERLSEQELKLPATSQWEAESCQQILLTASEWAWKLVLPQGKTMQPGETGAGETQISHAQIPAPQRLWNNEHLLF